MFIVLNTQNSRRKPPSSKNAQSKGRISKRNKINLYNRSGWRIEGTLREFPKFKPINCWFDYPIHKIDDSGILQDIDADLNSKKSNWKRNFSKKKSPDEKASENQQSIEQSFTSLLSFNNSDTVTLKEMAESMGISEKTVRRKVKKAKGFSVSDGVISRDK